MISQAEFARMAGVTRQAIQFAVKEGRVILTKGKVDIRNDMNNAYLQRNEKKSTESKPINFDAKKTSKKTDGDLTEKLKAIKVQREKNKLLQEMGNYIPTSLVDAAFGELKKNLKESLDKLSKNYDEKMITEFKKVIETSCKNTERLMNGFRK
jgi:hypothetical protein